MRLRGLSLCGALALTGIAADHVRADIIWNEGLQGDLSNDRFLPTVFTLAPGSSDLIGVLTGDDGTGRYDRDYYSIIVPTGHVLSQVVLNFYLSADFAAFLGIQPGPIFPNDPDTVNPEDLLGWTLFGPNEQGLDLLPLMGAQGQTFTPPLPAGQYTFWAQQQGTFTDYAVTFVVEVPSPAAPALFAGFALAFPRRRRPSIPH